MDAPKILVPLSDPSTETLRNFISDQFRDPVEQISLDFELEDDHQELDITQDAYRPRMEDMSFIIPDQTPLLGMGNAYEAEQEALESVQIENPKQFAIIPGSLAHFLSIVMGVNSLALSEAFEDRNPVDVLSDAQKKWDRKLVQSLKAEVVAASAALLLHTRSAFSHAEMDDIIKYVGDDAATYMGRLLCMQIQATANRNPTKENIIQLLGWLNSDRKYYEEALAQRMKQRRTVQIDPPNRYALFLSIAMGVAGKSSRSAFGKAMPDFPIRRWHPLFSADKNCVKPFLGADVAAGMVNLMRYVRRFRSKLTEEDILRNPDLLYACARLLGRFVAAFEGNNAHNGSTRVSHMLMQNDHTACLRLVRSLLV
jgi:hypothetical protein